MLDRPGMVLPMPLPRSIARFNRGVTNRILGPLARYLPGFGIVVHTGRKTHRRYRTPVNVFPRADGYIIALTYGRDSDWALNVLAHGGCMLETRGRALRLAKPRLFRDERLLFVPVPLRLIPRLLAVFDFLELKLDDER